MMTSTTWTCHICGKERPDEKISVFSKEVPFGHNNEFKMKQNVRYCNDNPKCVAAAPSFNFIANKTGEQNV